MYNLNLKQDTITYFMYFISYSSKDVFIQLSWICHNLASRKITNEAGTQKLISEEQIKWSWSICYCYPIMNIIDDSDRKLNEFQDSIIKYTKYDSNLIDFTRNCSHLSIYGETYIRRKCTSGTN